MKEVVGGKRVVGFDVVSNRPKVAAYRAPGAPIAEFAVESVMDEVAKALAIDPVEFRLKNAAREGSRAAYGPKFGPIGLVDDLLVVIASLSKLVNEVHPDVVRSHWPGRGDALHAIQRSSEWSADLLTNRIGATLRGLAPRRGRRP